MRSFKRNWARTKSRTTRLKPTIRRREEQQLTGLIGPVRGIIMISMKRMFDHVNGKVE